MPAAIAGPSGMNAVAHAVEALYSPEANPIISMFAEAAIRAFGGALPAIADGSADVDVYAGAMYGAFLAGICLGSVGMGIHHKLCHTLGGSFDLPHAETHALMLPYAAAYNRDAAPEAMARIARALGGDDGDDGPAALFALMRRVTRTASLADLGMAPPDLDKAAELATQNPYDNPRPVTRKDVRELLQAAWEGRAP